MFLHDRVAGTTERISMGYTGEEGNSSSGERIAITPDGRYIAFSSAASNLVKNDTNGLVDVFVWDRITRTTATVSVSSTGEQANKWSAYPSISGDGRFVAFMSESSNLVEGDTNEVWDVFVNDRQSRSTERVSVSSAGEQTPRGYWSQYPSISGNGRYVAFLSGASNLVSGDQGGWDVFVRDRREGQTWLASQVSTDDWTDHSVMYPAITQDGQFIAFDTESTDMAPGDTSRTRNIFIRTTPFRQQVTFDSLCDLTRTFVAKPGVASSLCAKLRAASEAEQRGNLVARNAILSVFIHEVTAQSGKTLTREQADELLKGAAQLRVP